MKRIPYSFLRPAYSTRVNPFSVYAQLGFSYDWERELATTDTGYVKWTQWIFLKLFEKGLAFQVPTINIRFIKTMG